MLGLPSTQRLLTLPSEQRSIIADILLEMTGDARARAQESWRKNKGPMAVYWKTLGVYTNHLRRIVRP